jgi:hypothetical protein
MKKSVLCWVLITAALIIVMVCQGCTIKFKGSDMELDAHITRVFEFDGIELSHGQNR